MRIRSVSLQACTLRGHLLKRSCLIWRPTAVLEILASTVAFELEKTNLTLMDMAELKCLGALVSTYFPYS